MFKVLTCVSTAHDWRLVLLAATLCLVSVAAAVGLYARLPAAGAQRPAWLAVVGLVAGSGVWATHFVAMLAFEPQLRTGYEPFATAASLLIAIGLSFAAFLAASALPRWPAAAVGGGLMGAGVALMHFVGMSGLRTEGWIEWDPAYVVASLVAGFTFSVAGFALARPAARRISRGGAAILLALAICGLHFTAMTAVIVVPDAAITPPASLMSREAMAVTVAGLTVLVVFAAVGALTLDARGRRRAAEQLREAVHVMPEGLAVYDADDRLVAWNAAYETAMSAVALDLRAGQTFAEIIAMISRAQPGLDEGGRAAWIAERAEARRRVGEPTEVQAPDGRWLRIEHRPTGGGGLVTVIVDVTDLKRSAEALARARDEANAANKAKSEFLANMSHEVRTPMNGVIGMNALLLRTELTADQRQYAEAVRVSAECLLGLIDDILDISKLEAGKIELEAIDFSLETLVEDVVELLSARAMEKGLDIAAYIDDGARRMLKGDPTRWRQVLLNLLSNAVKFTERGFVSVEVKSRPAGPGQTALRIEVSDTGLGLTPEAKARLFQKFQQADGSITRRFGGTGLGLSICRQLVDLMGGEIGVADRPGGGCVFWIEATLPDGEGREPRRRTRACDLAGVRILVVDDIELNRSIFGRQLEGEGAAVEQVEDGPAALDAIGRADAAGRPYEVVLLDHMMPEMAGEEVAERIRAHAEWRQPKLVLASSIGKPLSSDRAARVGFDAFLAKPVRLKTLLDCLSTVLADRQPEAEPVSPAAEAQAEPAEPAEAVVGRILLAEDNAINILLARTLLETVGHQVEVALDGAQAVEAARRGGYDLILMDVQMPVMDGLEATRRIRAFEDGAGRTPIVAMTANAMADDIEVCLAAGMDEHVSKPIEAESFLNLVATLIDKEKAVAESPQGPEVDEVQLDGLAALMTAARYQAMLEAYLAESQDRMRRMEAQVEAGELPALAAEAHALKAAAAGFGARRLRRLAEELMRACRAGQGDVAASLVKEIRVASKSAWAAATRRLVRCDQTIPLRRMS